MPGTFWRPPSEGRPSGVGGEASPGYGHEHTHLSDPRRNICCSKVEGPLVGVGSAHRAGACRTQRLRVIRDIPVLTDAAGRHTRHISSCGQHRRNTIVRKHACWSDDRHDAAGLRLPGLPGGSRRRIRDQLHDERQLRPRGWHAHRRSSRPGPGRGHSRCPEQHRPAGAPGSLSGGNPALRQQRCGSVGAAVGQRCLRLGGDLRYRRVRGAGYCTLEAEAVGFSPGSPDLYDAPQVAPSSSGTVTILAQVPQNAPLQDVKVIVQASGSTSLCASYGQCWTAVN